MRSLKTVHSLPGLVIPRVAGARFKPAGASPGVLPRIASAFRASAAEAITADASSFFNPAAYFGACLVLARSLGVSTLMMPRDFAETRPEILAIRRDERIIWIQEESKPFRQAIPETDDTVILSGHSTNPLNQSKLAFFNALIDNKVTLSEQVLVLGGQAGDETDLGVFSVMSAGRNFPWLPDDGNFPISGHKAKEVFQATLNLALRFAHEGGDGERIATTFVLGTTDQLRTLVTDDKINYLPASRKSVRRIQDDESIDAVRGLALMEGVFLVNTRGTVEAFLDGHGMNAKEISQNQEFLSIEVTEAGDVRVYLDGKNALDFEKTGRVAGRIEPEVMVQGMLNFSRRYGIKTILIPEAAVKDNQALAQLQRSERIGWLAAHSTEPNPLRQAQDFSIAMDEAPLSRLSFLRLAFFKAFLDGNISPTEEVLVATGLGGRASLDTLSLMSLRKVYPWLDPTQPFLLKDFRGKEVLMAALSSALKLVSEEKNGKKVGTIIVVGETAELTKHTKSLNEFPMAEIRPAIRHVSQSAFLGKLAKMDGAIMISSEGLIEAACQELTAPVSISSLAEGLGTRHQSACAYTENTQTAAIVISKTGMIRVFYGGKLMLELGKPSPLAPSKTK